MGPGPKQDADPGAGVREQRAQGVGARGGAAGGAGFVGQGRPNLPAVKAVPGLDTQ